MANTNRKEEKFIKAKKIPQEIQGQETGDQGVDVNCEKDCTPPDSGDIEAIPPRSTSTSSFSSSYFERPEFSAPKGEARPLKKILLVSMAILALGMGGYLMSPHLHNEALEKSAVADQIANPHAQTTQSGQTTQTTQTTKQGQCRVKVPQAGGQNHQPLSPYGLVRFGSRPAPKGNGPGKNRDLGQKGGPIQENRAEGEQALPDCEP